MSHRNNGGRYKILLALFAGVLLVVAIGAGWAPWRALDDRGKAVSVTPAPAQTTIGAATEPDSSIDFEPGSAVLSVNASQVLAKVADAARADDSKVVQISGHYDADGDPVMNAALATQRAAAVRHALEANGISPARLLVDKPTPTTGGVDPRAARRVELHLR